ncbi:MAG: heavy-metal-associated domain-containing protein [Solobacterium sp.]|jgi:copper chaperone CopZ|nr:heavy-metal-associated domain-containing protein [Solobacterium sp.]MCH4222281.1 heavy-metal-associated domain-containing protein [Solobacterium sp.]MCH4265384.1 heavy-metal-associated domain-containing protein [Solobacterium sp.]
MTALIGTMIVILFLLAISHVRKTLMHGCCGGCETVKRNAVKDRNVANYPYYTILAVDGMHCSNCAAKVANALNALPGVYAEVNLDQRAATVHMKHLITDRTLTDSVRQAGYSARINSSRTASADTAVQHQ